MVITPIAIRHCLSVAGRSRYPVAVKLDKADMLFSRWIKLRDNYTCQRCFKQYPEGHRGLHNSHFVGRRKENTRFMEENAMAACYGCHQYLTSHPQEHYLFQVERLGQDVVDKIILASSMYKKRDRKLEAMFWKNKLESLKK